MEFINLLQEHGAKLFTAVLDLITIILVIKNKPKTAEQIQALKKKQAEKANLKAEKYARKTREALAQVSNLEKEIEK